MRCNMYDLCPALLIGSTAVYCLKVSLPEYVPGIHSIRSSRIDLMICRYHVCFETSRSDFAWIVWNKVRASNHQFIFLLNNESLRPGIDVSVIKQYMLLVRHSMSTDADEDIGIDSTRKGVLTNPPNVLSLDDIKWDELLIGEGRLAFLKTPFHLLDLIHI